MTGPEFPGLQDVVAGVSVNIAHGVSVRFPGMRRGLLSLACFLGKVCISYALISNSSYLPHPIIRIIETLVPDLIIVVKSEDCCSVHLVTVFSRRWSQLWYFFILLGPLFLSFSYIVASGFFFFKAYPVSYYISQLMKMCLFLSHRPYYSYCQTTFAVEYVCLCVCGGG